MLARFVIFAVIFAVGVLGWTLLEYVIHGPMSHLFDTFAAPLHAAHHRNPGAVFTVGAWGPLLIASAAIFLLIGFDPWTVFWLGLLSGFAGYEVVHYRFHFCEPWCALEQRLRLHHLAHHYQVNEKCFGVTTTLWDHAFGSAPERSDMARLRAAVAGVPPLSGQSNLRLALRPWLVFSRPAGPACEQAGWESARRATDYPPSGKH